MARMARKDTQIYIFNRRCMDILLNELDCFWRLFTQPRYQATQKKLVSPPPVSPSRGGWGGGGNFEILYIKLSCHRQRLLTSPLKRGVGVCRGKLTHPFILSF